VTPKAPPPPEAPARTAEQWNAQASAALYGVHQWGEGFFSIDDGGHLIAHPSRDPRHGIDLYALTQQLAEKGWETPLLVRFTDTSAQRVADMHQAFEQVRQDQNYTGDYRCVYPIKANQQRHVVEEFHEAGKAFGFGLEAGSKPVLGVVDDDATPIVCNGFKDADYAEAIVLAKALGRCIMPVIEKATELSLLLDAAAQHGATLDLGVRVKLASAGSGMWQESGGSKSKFGLTVPELLDLIGQLQREDLTHTLKLLHFHIGSQINSIAHIRSAVAEGTRLYSELRALGAGVEYLDVGGGLGVDYEGTKALGNASMNYDLEEYASAVVEQVREACDAAGQPHPTLLSESGRALVAYHSLLITDVLGVSSPTSESQHELSDEELQADDLPAPVLRLRDAATTRDESHMLDRFHQAQGARQEVHDLFRLGHCTLQHRALAERCFARVCSAVHDQLLTSAEHLPVTPEDERALEQELADTVFLNLSVFQSLPDHWALRQPFPVMPIHRLNEQPTRHAQLVDITCDSDGRICKFIGDEAENHTLPLPPAAPANHAEPRQLIGIFLVGAYQETLGDLHNLFGDPNAVHVRLGDQGQTQVQEIIPGDTLDEVLRYVQYDPQELRAWVRASVKAAREAQQMTPDQAARLLKLYDHMLKGRTYLT